MGLFDPVWKTKDRGRLSKAYAAIQRISDADRLNQIILNAPLDEVRIEAMTRLSSISKGKGVQMNEAACIDALLSLNRDDAARTRLLRSSFGRCEWYMNFLFSGIKDERKRMDLILRDPDFGKKTIDIIRDEAFLMKIAENPSAGEALRTAAAERITDEKILRGLAGNASLPQCVREAVKKKTDKLDEAARQRQEAEALRKKQEACGISGHQLELVKTMPHGNGGKDGLYRCTKCGAEQIWPLEWSSADSV